MGINRRRREAQDRLAGRGFVTVSAAVTDAAAWVSGKSGKTLHPGSACCAGAQPPCWAWTAAGMQMQN